MTVFFCNHAQQRLQQRAHIPVGLGRKLVKEAIQNQITNDYIEKYRKKNLTLDPTVNVYAYKHIMFVVRITGTRIFVITELLVH